jgi:hypothetical protein
MDRQYVIFWIISAICRHGTVVRSFSVEPPPYNKEMVYENNEAVFEVVDATAVEAADQESI